MGWQDRVSEAHYTSLAMRILPENFRIYSRVPHWLTCHLILENTRGPEWGGSVCSVSCDADVETHFLSYDRCPTRYCL
jgi:hypothetical protein